MKEIRHFLRIRVKPDVVFRALTTEEGIKGWWTEEAERKEGVWQVSFMGEHYSELKVVEEAIDRKVVWEGLMDDPWKKTRIGFDFEAEGDNTTIMRLCHSGFPDDTDLEMIDNMNYNWGRFMFGLKTFCETGRAWPVVGKK